MEKIKLNILGKAPSLADIEEYNTYYSNKAKSLFMMLPFLCGIILMIMVTTDWLSGGLYSLNSFMSIVLLSIIFAFGMVERDKREIFISTKLCDHLSYLIIKYPEIAAYRAQVVAHGREFLKSEYKACVDFDEKKSYLEIYSPNVLLA